jgi:hypothetical protein
MHHQEIQDMEANEDVDIEGGEEPASSKCCLVRSLGIRDRVRKSVMVGLLAASFAFAPLGY